eukprot:TRINITY_DN15361_c0_g1_i3.p1 TRINITY_DN15361_c0_g1~~TRINITY_DN15361_c0_g1_i3.p1  ORF type:complete len:191 (+),score=64.39 TRINITY_DN15361_c0_g1_i3:73-645(+)
MCIRDRYMGTMHEDSEKDASDNSAEDADIIGDSEGDEMQDIEEDKQEEIQHEEVKEQKATKLKDKIREEKRLRQMEKANLAESQPQSLEDFEKAVVGEPSNSLIWLQYVAFMLDNAGTESARRVLERAVKTVLPTEVQDKLNLWIGYLNLESTYGDTKSLQNVAARAIEINDKKKIYNACILYTSDAADE